MSTTRFNVSRGNKKDIHHKRMVKRQNKKTESRTRITYRLRPGGFMLQKEEIHLINMDRKALNKKACSVRDLLTAGVSKCCEIDTFL